MKADISSSELSDPTSERLSVSMQTAASVSDPNCHEERLLEAVVVQEWNEIDTKRLLDSLYGLAGE
jgi:hypothetical protein